MTVETDTKDQATARKLMEILLYDNGQINRFMPDTIDRYPQRNLDEVAAGCAEFFGAHPEMLTDENLDEIASGEFTENNEKYRIYPEFAALDGALERFFDED